MPSKAHITVQSKADSASVEHDIKASKPVLILYHAHWCPHCVDFVGPFHEPSRPWQQICEHVKKQFKGKITCVEVEEGHMKHLPNEYKHIRGFPTLLLIQSAGVAEYQGARDDPQQVCSFIEKVSGVKMGGAKAKPKVVKPKVVKPKVTSKKPLA